MILLTLAAFAHLAAAAAARPEEPPMMGTQRAPMLVDYRNQATLPRRFRNHCGFDPATSRHYCSNSCGTGYEFFYCSAHSFGCCDIGRGYCDEDARLRCSPFNPVLFPELRNLPRGGGAPIESGEFWHRFKKTMSPQR